MNLTTLTLFNFRNLQNQTVDFRPGLNLIVGQNGSGKTNLIEAVSILARTKSFRTTQLQETTRWGQASSSVFGDIELSQGREHENIGVVIKGKRKEFFLNKEREGSIGNVLGKLICITFSPTDLFLVKGPPQIRRQFLDRHVVDLMPDVLPHLMNYQRALKNKIALLKNPAAVSRELKHWNSILAEETLPILKARKNLIDELQTRANLIMYELSDGKETLDLSIKSKFVENHAELNSAALNVYFESFEQEELRTRTSMVGPHRDDLSVRIDGQSARAYASQGQTRSIVLALKLAMIELLETSRGESPVLLLDDVESELDIGRRQALTERLFKSGRQVFVTGADLGSITLTKGMDAHCLSISDGLVNLLN